MKLGTQAFGFVGCYAKVGEVVKVNVGGRLKDVLVHKIISVRSYAMNSYIVIEGEIVNE